MNPYLKNVNKIEFVVTDACTGRCRHCSQGERSVRIAQIDSDIAADAVRKIAAHYPVETVMTFGGEPLLHTSAVYAIMRAAREAAVPHRQVITNGYFSSDEKKIAEVAEALAGSGVNDLLLSVDAFHQETIPLDVVTCFAAKAVECGIPVRLQPAWLVGPRDDNPYNRKTRELLATFGGMAIPVGEGNIIFPEGNALKHLSAYFEGTLPENPYVENPRDVRCISFSANGDVLGGNVYREDIMEILKGYRP